jgi:hypothetical protein
LAQQSTGIVADDNDRKSRVQKLIVTCLKPT